MFFDSVVSIERLKRDSDNSNKESYVANQALQTVKINIQPASAEESIMVDGVFVQTYTGFTTNSGLKVGDKITVSGTATKFRVKGISDWSLPDLIPHYEYILVRFEEEDSYA